MAASEGKMAASEGKIPEKAIKRIKNIIDASYTSKSFTTMMWYHELSMVFKRYGDHFDEKLVTKFNLVNNLYEDMVDDEYDFEKGDGKHPKHEEWFSESCEFFDNLTELVSNTK